MNELRFLDALLVIVAIFGIVLVTLVLIYLASLIFTPPALLNTQQVSAFIKECRALEVSMETCERLAAKVLGG